MDRFTTLLSELRERFQPDVDVREVEIYLASRGYDARQIGEIHALFTSEVDGPDAASSPRAQGGGAGGPTFRVMGAYERTRFTPEAWGHLIGLAANGILTPADREQVIERAILQTDGRIGLDELRALLEGAGLDDGGSPGSTTIH
jgi:uncharacterized protein Smg (DUF494 family)